MPSMTSLARAKSPASTKIQPRHGVSSAMARR